MRQLPQAAIRPVTLVFAALHFVRRDLTHQVFETDLHAGLMFNDDQVGIYRNMYLNNILKLTGLSSY